MWRFFYMVLGTWPAFWSRSSQPATRSWRSLMERLRHCTIEHQQQLAWMWTYHPYLTKIPKVHTILSNDQFRKAKKVCSVRKVGVAKWTVSSPYCCWIPWWKTAGKYTAGWWNRAAIHPWVSFDDYIINSLWSSPLPLARCWDALLIGPPRERLNQDVRNVGWPCITHERFGSGKRWR